jgi:hypothetical protein
LLSVVVLSLERFSASSLFVPITFGYQLTQLPNFPSSSAYSSPLCFKLLPLVLSLHSYGLLPAEGPGVPWVAYGLDLSII